MVDWTEVKRYALLDLLQFVPPADVTAGNVKANKKKKKKNRTNTSKAGKIDAARLASRELSGGMRRESNTKASTSATARRKESVLRSLAAAKHNAESAAIAKANLKAAQASLSSLEDAESDHTGLPAPTAPGLIAATTTAASSAATAATTLSTAAAASAIVSGGDDADARSSFLSSGFRRQVTGDGVRKTKTAKRSQKKA
jgi:hypothetical protein